MPEPDALAATRELLDAGTQPETILEEGLTHAMLELGERWNRGLARTLGRGART